MILSKKLPVLMIKANSTLKRPQKKADFKAYLRL